MRWTPRLLLVACVAGCLRDPDPGGQEGEEIRNLGEADGGGDLGTADSGFSEDDGDTAETGETDDADVADELDASAWTGTLTVERGTGADPTARDCVLTFDMAGTASEQACDDCVSVFDVEHVLDSTETTGREACADLPDRFMRTYGLRPGDGGGVEVSVLDGDGAPVPYATAALSGGLLDWSVGLVEVPSAEPSGATTYRTDVEVGVVSLD